ncbi:MAG TPA: NAD(P)H nitroreductase [Pseudomonas oleovorans]|nr:NAD(P)H nitroreductase [Pseudomonas oleovorans]
MTSLAIARPQYSIRKFDPSRTIERPVLNELLDALRYSPSPTNLQPWRFLIAESAVTKAQLADAAKQVDANRNLELLDASHFILLCRLSDMSDSHLQALLAQEAAEGRFSDGSAQIAQHHARARRVNLHRYERKDLAHWMDKHVYLALGSLISHAAALGIDAVPMEYFDQASVDAAFQLPQQGLTGVLLVALGYRSRDNGDGPVKSRLPADRIFMFR